MGCSASSELSAAHSITPAAAADAHQSGSLPNDENVSPAGRRSSLEEGLRLPSTASESVQAVVARNSASRLRLPPSTPALGPPTSEPVLETVVVIDYETIGPHAFDHRAVPLYSSLRCSQSQLLTRSQLADDQGANVLLGTSQSHLFPNVSSPQRAKKSISFATSTNSSSQVRNGISTRRDVSQSGDAGQATEEENTTSVLSRISGGEELLGGSAMPPSPTGAQDGTRKGAPFLLSPRPNGSHFAPQATYPSATGSSSASTESSSGDTGWSWRMRRDGAPPTAEGHNKAPEAVGPSTDVSLADQLREQLVSATHLMRLAEDLGFGVVGNGGTGSATSATMRGCATGVLPQSPRHTTPSDVTQSSGMQGTTSDSLGPAAYGADLASPLLPGPLGSISTEGSPAVMSNPETTVWLRNHNTTSLSPQQTPFSLSTPAAADPTPSSDDDVGRTGHHSLQQLQLGVFAAMSSPLDVGVRAMHTMTPTLPVPLHNGATVDATPEAPTAVMRDEASDGDSTTSHRTNESESGVNHINTYHQQHGSRRRLGSAMGMELSRGSGSGVAIGS